MTSAHRTTESSPSIACQPHDHSHCIDSALAEAAHICKQNGEKFTQLREQVLRLIWQNHKPLGAYDLMDQLASLNTRKVAPPTVYRTLDFLQRMGLVHRLNSLNAFIGCPHPSEQHSGLFFICQCCHNVIELEQNAIQTGLSDAASSQNFQIQNSLIEINGLCQACQQEQGVDCQGCHEHAELGDQTPESQP